MAPNSENPMALLLFAILKQHNLKNVNWDKVAQDPDLPEQISNGHAARMRFFRFRESVQGQARKKNNRCAADSKSKVTKPKKPQRKGVVIKSEMDAMSPYGQYSPASTTSPYLDEFDDRFPTPFSDDVSIASGRKSSVLDPAVVPGNFGTVDAGANLFGSDFDAAFFNTDPSLDSTLDFSDPHVLGDSTPDWMHRMQ